MSKWHQSFVTIIFSLSLVIILFSIATLVTYSIQQSNNIKEENNYAALLQAKRFQLLMTMRKQAAKRAILLNRILVEDDPFVINDLFDQFHHTSAVSVIALNKFAKLPLSQQEQEVLSQLRASMIKTGASQNKVLDDIVEERLQQAKQLLKQKTLRYQEQTLVYMATLQESIEQWYRKKIEQITLQHQHIIKTIFYTGSALFFFSSLVIIFIIKYIFSKEKLLVKRAQVTLDSINQSIIATDPNGVVDYLNPFAQRMCQSLGMNPKGKKLQQNFPLQCHDHAITLDDQIQKVIQSKTPFHQKETCLLEKNEQKLWLHYEIAPILDNNKILGTNIILHDVSAIHNLNQKLKWQANHDALTGLFNRRYLDNAIERSVQHAHNSAYQSILCYIDLDDFKNINDQAGHPAGDQLLVDIAQILLSQVREYDVVARIGGDEFVILFYRCNLQQGREIASKILTRILNYQLKWNNTSYHIGASIGLAVIDQNTTTVESLIAKTDNALYQAKHQGKGRIVVNE